MEKHFDKELQTSLRRKERTVEILYGEFANSREPLDLTEEQGSYDKYSQGFKLRRGRTIDSIQ
jgi:hypothetical protein